MPATPQPWGSAPLADLAAQFSNGTAVELTNGNIFVVYNTTALISNPNGLTSTQGQTFDPAGNPIGDSVSLNSGISRGREGPPAVAALADGRAVVVFSNGDELLYRQFEPNALGRMEGGDVEFVATGGVLPDVAPQVTGDGTRFQVSYARTSPFGGERVLAQFQDGLPPRADIWAPTADGAQASAWNELGAIGLLAGEQTDGTLLLQRFTYAQGVTGDEFILSSPRGDVSDPSVISLPSGEFAIAFTVATRTGPVVEVYEVNPISGNLGYSFAVAGSDPTLAQLPDGTLALTYDDGRLTRVQRFANDGDGTRIGAAAGTGGSAGESNLLVLGDGRLVSLLPTAEGGLDLRIFDTADDVRVSPAGDTIGTAAGDRFSPDTLRTYAGAGNDVVTVDIRDDMVVDGGEGRDVLVVRTLAEPTAIDVVNLEQGVIGAFSADLPQGTIQNFEHVVAGDTNSFLFGSDFGNILNGRGGNDIIEGRGGNDRIIGGTGDDDLEGEGGNDVIFGGADDDTLNGGIGRDRLDGGSGFDTASYSGSRLGVTVNLETGRGAGGDATGDVLLNIERVVGSFRGDVLLGNDRINVLDGLDGNDRLEGGGGRDTLRGGDDNDVLLGGAGGDTLDGGDGDDILLGGAGADLIDGGDGTDVVSYADGQAGVIVALNNSAANDRFARGDVILNVENVVGTRFDDAIVGDGEANTLIGRGGDDMLGGLDGNDVLNGGLGDDWLFGDEGSDTATYVTAGTGVTADLAGVARARGEAAGDTYNSIENLEGSRFDDRLFGDNVRNVIEGGSGNDVLVGRGGGDLLTGGAGADTFTYLSVLDAHAESILPEVIFDFESGVDTINLGFIDADETLAGDQAFTFVRELSGRAGEIAIDGMAFSVGYEVMMDVDGGGADMIIEVFGDVPQLNDFIL